MLNIKYFIGIVIVVVAFSFSVNSKAFAAGNMHLGILEVYPVVSLEQEHDDNIFLETEGEENSDSITTTSLGLALQRPIVPARGEDLLFRADYTTDIIVFHEYTEQNRVDHTMHAVASLKSPKNFTLKLKEDFVKTSDPASSELTSPEKRFQNVAEVVFGYKMTKIGFDLGYKNTRDNYKKLQNLDKTEEVITPAGYYEIFPKTEVFAEYNLGSISYDDNSTNSDSEYGQWQLGIQGEITPKLTGVFKAGHKQQEYDQSDKKEAEGFTIYGDLTYKLSERTSLYLYSKRISEESTYATSSYYKTNEIDLRLKHQLYERLFLTTKGSYQRNDYPDTTTEGSQTGKRKDTILNAKLGLNYEVKDGVSLEVSYEHKQRGSRFDTYEYKDNKFLAKISLLF